MNPDQPSRDQIETRITALLLGELPANEAELLRYTISRDPALQKLHDQLQSTLALVREAEKHPAEPPAEKPAPLKLSDDRRQKLLVHFKTARPEVQKDPLFWLNRVKVRQLVMALVVAAILGIFAALLLPATKNMGSERMSLDTQSDEQTARRAANSALVQAEEKSVSKLLAESPAPPVNSGLLTNAGIATLGNSVTPGHGEDLFVAGATTTSSPIPVALPPEPQLTPPPTPVQIVLPQTETTPETGSAAQPTAGLLPADQLAAQVMAPSTGHVYSQQIVGYVATPPPNGSTKIPSTPPPATAAQDTFAVQTADSEAVLRQDNKTTLLQSARDARAFSDRVTRTPGSLGGVGGIGGGGAPAGGVYDTGLSADGTTKPTFADNISSDLPATAGQNSAIRNPQSAIESPETTTISGRSDLTFDDSRANRSLGVPSPTPAPSVAAGEPAQAAAQIPDSARNPIGAFPGAVPATPGSELAANEPQSEESGRRYTTATRERGTDSATLHSFYRNPTQSEEEKKIPIVGDVPVVGSLFQSSAEVPAAGQAATVNGSVPPPPSDAAKSVAMNWNLGEPASQPQPAGIGGSIPLEKPTAVSGLPANSFASDHDQNGFVFNLDKGDSSQAAGTLNQTFAENQPASGSPDSARANSALMKRSQNNNASVIQLPRGGHSFGGADNLANKTEEERLPGVASAAPEDSDEDRKLIEAERQREIAQYKSNGKNTGFFTPLSSDISTNSDAANPEATEFAQRMMLAASQPQSTIGSAPTTLRQGSVQVNYNTTTAKAVLDTDESKLRMEIERFRQTQGSPSAGGAGSGNVTNPEWIGMLDHPEQPKTPENHFVGRNAYIALPSTNYLALDDSGGRTVNFGPSASSPDKEKMIASGTMDFQGIDVSEALDIYAKLTQRTLLRSTLPQGQIIFGPQQAMTRTQAINVLESALAINGVSLVNVGDKFVKAIPSDQASGMGAEIDRSASTNTQSPDSYVTQVIQLKYVKPSVMAQVIRPLANPTNSISPILPIDDNGTLVLRGRPENVQRMMAMIAQVDVSVPTEYISEAIPIRYTKADDIASQLTALTGAEDQHGMPLFGQTKVIVNESSSSLLIYATRSDMETIKYALSKLDTPEKAATQTDLPLRKPAPNTPVPQPEILTSSNNFSTFSMNVSDVSFKFAEASLENNKLPDTASIRSEEFVNAFDYRDPEAAPGQPMAFNSELAQYPFNQNRELLRFSVKAAASGRQAGRALNLVLLLDTSGSMERADRVEIIREALRVLSAQLQPNDVVSVVSFARTARLWADGISGDKAGETLDKVGSITPEGGTNLEEAMRLAYETARRHYLPDGMNRVVLLTDGAANLGNVDPNALDQKVDAQRKQGIALDCFGIGWEDYNDDLLEELSSNGDGRYAFLNSPTDAARDFGTKLAGALQVAAQDLKVQVEFNPQRVTAYRQIGYAKHQLTKEQFRDNTVAAGEIASQEAGNALYTIETNPNGDGPIATVHVRYRVPGTQDYREHSWDVPYTGHVPGLDQSSPAMRLAATAAAFSEWLAASPYAQEVTPDELLKYLAGVPEIYGADDRPKQLETMIREAQSLEGK